MSNLDQVAKALGFDERNTPSDYHVYGTVTELNSDGSAQVSLNASTVDTRCALGCNVNVDDRVLVVIKSDGKAVVIGNITNHVTHSLPAGGNAEQYIRKVSSADYDVAWGDLTELIYDGSSTATTNADSQVTLTKSRDNFSFLIVKFNVDTAVTSETNPARESFTVTLPCNMIYPCSAYNTRQCICSYNYFSSDYYVMLAVGFNSPTVLEASRRAYGSSGWRYYRIQYVWGVK